MRRQCLAREIWLAESLWISQPCGFQCNWENAAKYERAMGHGSCRKNVHAVQTSTVFQTATFRFFFLLRGQPKAVVKMAEVGASPAAEGRYPRGAVP